MSMQPRSRIPGTSRPSTWPSQLALLAGLVTFLLILALLLGGRDGRQSLTYSRFLDLVDEGRVVKVEVGSEQVSGVYQERDELVEFVSTRPPGTENEALLRELRAHKVEFTGSRPSGLSSFLRNFLLPWVLPIVLLFALWRLILRRAQPGIGAMT